MIFILSIRGLPSYCSLIGLSRQRLYMSAKGRKERRLPHSLGGCLGVYILDMAFVSVLLASYEGCPKYLEWGRRDASSYITISPKHFTPVTPSILTEGATCQRKIPSKYIIIYYLFQGIKKSYILIYPRGVRLVAMWRRLYSPPSSEEFFKGL